MKMSPRQRRWFFATLAKRGKYKSAGGKSYHKHGGEATKHTNKHTALKAKVPSQAKKIMRIRHNRATMSITDFIKNQKHKNVNERDYQKVSHSLHRTNNVFKSTTRNGSTVFVDKKIKVGIKTTKNKRIIFIKSITKDKKQTELRRYLKNKMK